jgi:hypothetical protein
MQGLDIGLVVTSLETGLPEHVYETIYCAAGREPDQAAQGSARL